MKNSTNDQSQKPKVIPILTSSGGGGHIAAAKARKQELEKKYEGKLYDENKNPTGIKIEIIDLMGEYAEAKNHNDPWIPTWRIAGIGTVFSGKENTKKWNDAQKKGGIDSVRTLESLVDKQWIAERIQAGKVYKKLKEYLNNNDVQEIYNTQALSTPSICQAIAEHNEKEEKNLKLVATVTEFLTHKAVHFLNPLSKIKPAHRKVLKVEVTEPPLCSPGETPKEFLKSHGVENIDFVYLSEKGKEPPVRKEFKEFKKEDKDEIIIKAKKDVVGVPTNELPEHSYIKKQLGEAGEEKSDNEFSVTKGPNDKLATITMGSQGSSTVLEYIDQFVEQAKNYKGNGNLYLAILAGKNEGDKSLYAQARAHIQSLQNQGKIPKNTKILPLAFQDGKHMASLLYNSDVLVTRSGGMSSIEAKYTGREDINPNRQVYVHSEEVTSPDTFPKHNYDAVYEGLISGTVKWEGGNAEYLMKNIKASLGSPTTIDFGLSEKSQNKKKLQSLFSLAYEDCLKKEHISDIKKLIYQGSNPNLLLPGNPPLSVLAYCKDYDTAKSLVDHGAKITKEVAKKLLANGNIGEQDLKKLKQAEKNFKSQFKKQEDLLHKELKNAQQDNNKQKIKGIAYVFGRLGYSKEKEKALEYIKSPENPRTFTSKGTTTKELYVEFSSKKTRVAKDEDFYADKENRKEVTNFVNQKIDELLESKQLEEIFPKITSKNNSKIIYETKKENLIAAKVGQDLFDFFPSDNFSGITRVQRKDPKTGVLLSNQFDTMEYKKGKLISVFTAVEGKSRINNLNEKIALAQTLKQGITVVEPVESKDYSINLADARHPSSPTKTQSIFPSRRERG